MSRNNSATEATEFPVGNPDEVKSAAPAPQHSTPKPAKAPTINIK